MKNKTLILLLVIFLIGIIIYGVKFRSAPKFQEDVEESVTDEIENESYYKEKEEEFVAKEDEYEDTLTEYINSRFSEEEKNKLEEYNQKMTEAVKKGNGEEKKTLSHEKTAYIKEVSKKKFTKEQLEKLEQIQKRIDELEPIVNEYVEKQIELEEKRFWEGREKLEDGTIVNKREAVIKEKECNGLKFSNIELKYNSEQKCSKFSAKVTNISNEVKQEKVSVKITGDVEMIFPIDIERLEPGEYYDFEIEIQDNISMAGTLEIIKYNEEDYK